MDPMSHPVFGISPSQFNPNGERHSPFQAAKKVVAYASTFIMQNRPCTTNVDKFGEIIGSRLILQCFKKPINCAGLSGNLYI